MLTHHVPFSIYFPNYYIVAREEWRPRPPNAITWYAPKKNIIKWDVFFNEIGPNMEENARRILLWYAPTHFHEKKLLNCRSEKSPKSNDVVCASRFRDDKKKHTKTYPCWCWSNENQYKMIIRMTSFVYFSSRAPRRHKTWTWGTVGDLCFAPSTMQKHGFPYLVQGFSYLFQAFPYFFQRFPYLLHGFPYLFHGLPGWMAGWLAGQLAGLLADLLRVWIAGWLVRFAVALRCGLGPWVPKCGADGFKTGSGYAPGMRRASKRYAPISGNQKYPMGAASFHICSIFLSTFWSFCSLLSLIWCPWARRHFIYF